MVKNRKKKSAHSLEDWADLIKSKGMAGELASNTDVERAVVEESVCREWVQAMRLKWAVNLDLAGPSESDPPDYYVFSNGTKKSVELTELKDGLFEKKFSLAKMKLESYSAYGGEGFSETQWDQNRFENEIKNRISKKDMKYTAKGYYFDVLLIYSGEQWLLPTDVLNWLERIAIDSPNAFASVYFLLKYSPGFSNEHWPIFHLAGKKIGQHL